jgi:hypothetical protein
MTAKERTTKNNTTINIRKTRRTRTTNNSKNILRSKVNTKIGTAYIVSR